MAITNHAQVAQGATISIGGITGASGTETFSLIGDFMSLSLAGGDRTIIDVSTLASTGKEKLGGLADPGKATLMVNRRATGADPGDVVMQTAWGGPGYAYDFKIQLPINPTAAQTVAGDHATFSAIVSSGPKMDFAIDKAIQIEWGLDISGPFTWTAGS